MQGLALDVKVLTEDKEEIGLRELVEDDEDDRQTRQARDDKEEVELDLDNNESNNEEVLDLDEETASVFGSENDDDLFDFDDDDI